MNKAIYLKVNRFNDYSFHCIKYWLSVARCLKYERFILCDNDALKTRLLSSSEFDLEGFSFISSDKYTNTSSIATKRWENAANAHFTTFYHAYENGFNEFWNIDADDTSFCLLPNETAKLLKMTETKAKASKAEIVSLDFWKTWYHGFDWTFGISFVDCSATDWISVIERFGNSSNSSDIESFLAKQNLLIRKYHLEHQYNVDFFFYYLRECHAFNIETFIPINTAFIHWGGPWGGLCYRYCNSMIWYCNNPIIALLPSVRTGFCMVGDDNIVVDTDFSFLDMIKSSRQKNLKELSGEYRRISTYYRVIKQHFVSKA